MSQTVKIWLAVAAFLVIFGIVILVLRIGSVDWDFSKLGTGKYETNTYTINDEFGDISIEANTADIIFLPSDDGACRVSCYEEERQKHSVEVRNGTLTISVLNDKKWYDHIGINFTSPRITVYIPQSECGALAISSDTSDIELPNDFKFKSIDVSVSTGDVNVMLLPRMRSK